MFHRVKSEVSENEQTSQSEEKRYVKDNERTIPGRVERSQIRDEDRPQRVYGRTPITTPTSTQEEDRVMRPKESSPVQGKYARETESEQETVATAPRAESYKSAVTRGGYGGSSYAPSSFTPPEAPVYAGNDRTLTIGRGINMSGEIEACDHLMVEGTVEAALKGAKLLEIAESGTFYGTVEIEEATIAGRFEGDITVNGRLILKATGVITGSIAYRALEVETGAVIDGRMTPLKGTVDPKALDKYRAGSEASAMAKAKEADAKKGVSREPANTETGLFSKAHASY